MSTTIYRSAAFLFSIVCYGVFLLVFLYLLAFLGKADADPANADLDGMVHHLAPLVWDSAYFALR